MGTWLGPAQEERQGGVYILISDFNHQNTQWAYDIIKMASDATALCFIHESVDRYGEKHSITLTD